MSDHKNADSVINLSDFMGFDPIFRADSEHSTVVVFVGDHSQEIDIVSMTDEKSITTRLDHEQARKLYERLHTKFAKAS